jgi:glycerol-3-phosphate dehydrogenase
MRPGAALAVALIDRSDFGSGSSFNHLRTIHGGLRYLQTLDLGRARTSVRERRTLARIAPHSVRPVPFVLPLYRSLLRGKLALRAGFLLDRMIAWDRNRRIAQGLALPAGRVVSARARRSNVFPGCAGRD